MGRYGCDPPLSLITTFLDKIKASESDIDVILMPGDFLRHGMSFNPDEPNTGDYSLLKQTIQQIALLIAKYFPDVIIIPTIGNNDSKNYF